MIGVLVTFRYGNDFNEAAVRKIADTARAKFEGMPGLRSKAFTLDPENHEATNFYVWESDEAAKAFFTDELPPAGNRSVRRAPERAIRGDRDASGERLTDGRSSSHGSIS